MMVKHKSTIVLNNKTKDSLRSLGKKGQSFDKLLNDILNHINKCDRWWCDR